MFYLERVCKSYMIEIVSVNVGKHSSIITYIFWQVGKQSRISSPFQTLDVIQ